MGKHLSEDEIKYVISAEVSGYQQSIHKITQENKNLSKEERIRKNQMVELEAQGKKNTQEYKNLAASAKTYSDKIAKNRKEISDLTSKMDVNALSMNQLKKRAKELQSQLDNTAEALNPKEYAKTASELEKVRSRMGDLRNNGKEVNKEFDLNASIMSKMKAAAVAFITVKLGEYLGAIGMKAYETRKEFAKYEAVLTNTLGSQEKAQESMKMLQQIAKNSPGSLSEWTEGFIKLVNRGINPTKEQLVNIGDIAASQGKSTDQFIEALLDGITGENERLKEFGITANRSGETTKYTFKGVTTEVQNTDAAITKYLLSLGNLQGVQGSMAVQMNQLEGLESNFGDTMDSLFNKIGKRLEPFFKSVLSSSSQFVSDLGDAIEPITDQFSDQFDKVVELEGTLSPLAERYDELTSKGKLTKQEHIELNSVINSIAVAVPSAISAWDKYGNAIGISTDKVYEFINAEKARLRYVYKQDIADLKEKRRQIQKDLTDDKIKKYVYKTTPDPVNPYGGTKTYSNRSPAEEAELNKSIAQNAADLAGIDAQLAKLTGDDIDRMVKRQVAETKAQAKARTDFMSMNKAKLSAWIKDEKNAASQYKAIAQEVYDSQFGGSTKGGGSQGKKDKQKKVDKLKVALDAEKQLYEQQQIDLKTLYVSGEDEELKSQEAFNEASEQLAIMHLQRSLEIVGVNSDQGKEIQQQLLDFKIKCLEDYYKDQERIEKDAADKEKSLEQKKLNESEENERKKKEILDRTSDQYKDQVDRYKQYGSAIGESLGNVLSGQEDMLKAFGDTMIDILFDVLTQIVNQKIVEATAVAVAEQAKAAAIATALPSSVITGGATAVPRIAIIGGLIMAALAAAKSTLKGLISSKSSSSSNSTSSSSGSKSYVATGKESGGSIDVIRAQDGKMFPGANYNPDARGFIDRPTVIVGEGPSGRSREWVASNAAVNNPTIAPILNIIDQSQKAGTIRTLDLNGVVRAKMAGYSSGGYIEKTSQGNNGGSQYSVDVTSTDKLVKALEKLITEGIPADVVLTDLERKQKMRDRSRRLATK